MLVNRKLYRTVIPAKAGIQSLLSASGGED